MVCTKIYEVQNFPNVRIEFKHWDPKKKGQQLLSIVMGISLEWGGGAFFFFLEREKVQVSEGQREIGQGRESHEGQRQREGGRERVYACAREAGLT